MPFHSCVKHVTLVCVPMVGLSLALGFMNEALYCRVPWRVVIWDDCGHSVASQENKTLFRKRTYAWVWRNREFRRKSPTHVHLAPNLVIHQLYLCLVCFLVLYINGEGCCSPWMFVTWKVLYNINKAERGEEMCGWWWWIWNIYKLQTVLLSFLCEVRKEPQRI